MGLFASLSSPMERNFALIHYVLDTPGPHRLVLIGVPGIGKTKFVQAVARKLGVADSHFLRWSAAQAQPEDFNGWPTPRKEGLRFEAPERVRSLNDGQPALWMLDEFNLAPRSVQGAALRVLDEGWIGDEKLGDAVKIVAAMNPPEHAADAQDIAQPLANRCVWLPFGAPSKEDHIAYMLGTEAPSLDIANVSAEAREQARATVVGIYSGFMQARGNLLEDIAAEDVANRFPLAYATPRSWDYAINLAATCHAHEDDAAMLEILAGTIGRPQSLEFVAYYKTADLVAPALALEDPTLFEPSPQRPDRTFAQVTAVARYACDQKARKRDVLEQWHAAWGFIEHLMANGVPKDIVLPAAQYLGGNKPKGELLAEHVPTIRKLTPMVVAAGFDK